MSLVFSLFFPPSLPPSSFCSFSLLFQKTWGNDDNILAFDKNRIHNLAWFPNPQKLSHRDDQSFFWVNADAFLEGHNQARLLGHQG